MNEIEKIIRDYIVERNGIPHTEPVSPLREIILHLVEKNKVILDKSGDYVWIGTSKKGKKSLKKSVRLR